MRVLIVEYLGAPLLGYSLDFIFDLWHVNDELTGMLFAAQCTDLLVDMKSLMLLNSHTSRIRPP